MGVAMVTPMDAGGGIDFIGLEKLTRHLIDGGTNYLVVQGTTGESPVLSWDEKIAVLDKVIEVNAGRIPVVFGVGGNNTVAVVEQLAKVENKAIDGILSVSPAYNKPTQEGIVAHFKAVCAATNHDVILYNVPGRTSSNMTAATTLEIARSCSNAVAIKEASGDLLQITDILRARPAGFEVISGDDPLTYAMMTMGAVGVISVVGNVLPQILSDMVSDCASGDYSKALPTHFDLLDYTSMLFAEGNPGGAKAALNSLQICQEHMRLPLVPISAALRQRIVDETIRLTAN